MIHVNEAGQDKTRPNEQNLLCYGNTGTIFYYNYQVWYETDGAMCQIIADRFQAWTFLVKFHESVTAEADDAKTKC